MIFIDLPVIVTVQLHLIIKQGINYILTNKADIYQYDTVLFRSLDYDTNYIKLAPH